MRQPQLSVLVIPLGRAAREDQDLGTEDRASATAAYHRPAVSCARTLLPVTQWRSKTVSAVDSCLQSSHSLQALILPWVFTNVFCSSHGIPVYYTGIYLHHFLMWNLICTGIPVKSFHYWSFFTIALGSYLSVNSFFSVHLAMSTMCIYLLCKRSSQDSLS